MVGGVLLPEAGRGISVGAAAAGEAVATACVAATSLPPLTSLSPSLLMSPGLSPLLMPILSSSLTVRHSRISVVSRLMRNVSVPPAATSACRIHHRSSVFPFSSTSLTS